MAGEPLVQVDETAPLRPDSKAPYPATKARAEQAVRDAQRRRLRDGRPAAALRLGRRRYDAAARDGRDGRGRGRFAWVGGGPNLTATTHVANAVEGLVLAAERGAAGEAYFVTDGEPVVFREFVSALLRTQGVEPPDRNLPTWLAGPLAGVLGGGLARCCRCAGRRRCRASRPGC